MEEVDRVENAFRRFDTDGDGFIDWEEFKQVQFYFVLKKPDRGSQVAKNIDTEQARRIFETCDQVGLHRRGKGLTEF